MFRYLSSLSYRFYFCASGALLFEALIYIENTMVWYDDYDYTNIRNIRGRRGNESVQKDHLTMGDCNMH